jgi:hypothetical protein
MTAETIPLLMGIANYDTIIPFKDDMAFSFMITTVKTTRELNSNGIWLP